MEEKIEGIKDGQQVPLSDNIEITELHCHECNGYIKFALDKGKNGEHVVICPKCGHEHCRVIKDGVVTGDRWQSRNKDIPANQPSQPLVTIQNQVFYINVSMDNYSDISWQSVGTGGSNNPSCIDSWGNTTTNATYIAAGTAYYTYTFPT